MVRRLKCSGLIFLFLDLKCQFKLYREVNFFICTFAPAIVQSVENGEISPWISANAAAHRPQRERGTRRKEKDAESRQRCEWQAQKQVRNFGESEEGATLVSARYVTRLAANY